MLIVNMSSFCWRHAGLLTRQTDCTSLLYSVQVPCLSNSFSITNGRSLNFSTKTIRSLGMNVKFSFDQLPIPSRPIKFVRTIERSPVTISKTISSRFSLTSSATTPQVSRPISLALLHPFDVLIPSSSISVVCQSTNISFGSVNRSKARLRQRRIRFHLSRHSLDTGEVRSFQYHLLILEATSDLFLFSTDEKSPAVRQPWFEQSDANSSLNEEARRAFETVLFVRQRLYTGERFRRFAASVVDFARETNRTRQLTHESVRLSRSRCSSPRYLTDIFIDLFFYRTLTSE